MRAKPRGQQFRGLTAKLLTSGVALTPVVSTAAALHPSR